MSTKCTIYYQTKGDDTTDYLYDGYLHVYWEMGGHKAPGVYIDTGADVILVKDPVKLAEALAKCNVHA